MVSFFYSLLLLDVEKYLSDYAKDPNASNNESFDVTGKESKQASEINKSNKCVCKKFSNFHNSYLLIFFIIL